VIFLVFTGTIKLLKKIQHTSPFQFRLVPYRRPTKHKAVKRKNWNKLCNELIL